MTEPPGPRLATAWRVRPRAPRDACGTRPPRGGRRRSPERPGPRCLWFLTGTAARSPPARLSRFRRARRCQCRLDPSLMNQIPPLLSLRTTDRVDERVVSAGPLQSLQVLAEPAQGLQRSRRPPPARRPERPRLLPCLVPGRSVRKVASLKESSNRPDLLAIGGLGAGPTHGPRQVPISWRMQPAPRARGTTLPGRRRP